MAVIVVAILLVALAMRASSFASHEIVPSFTSRRAHSPSFLPNAVDDSSSSSSSSSSSLSSSSGEENHRHHRHHHRDVIDRLGLDEQFERWRFMQRLLEGDANVRDVEDVLLSSLSSYLRHGPSRIDAGDDGRADGNDVNDENNGGNASPVLVPTVINDIERVIFDMTSISDGIVVGGGSRFLHMLVSHPIDYEGTDVDDVVDEDIVDDRDDDSDDGDDDDAYDDMSTMHDVAMRDALSILRDIERLLPHPEDDEESHRSAWDVVIDLHGREYVRIMEDRLRGEIDEMMTTTTTTTNVDDGRYDRVRTADDDAIDDDDDDDIGLGSILRIRSRECLQWRTLCSIGRVLIHYDFLTRGVLGEGAFRRGKT